MQQANYPTRLQVLKDRDALRWEDIVIGTGLALATLRRWAKGESYPRDPEDREKLAQFFQCDASDFVPPIGMRGKKGRVARGEKDMFEKMDRHFMFGNIKTTIEALDGTGMEAYKPENITTHYDPEPATFFAEIVEAKREIEQEQEEKRLSGQPSQWNGEKYHLSGVVISREPVHEDMTLGLWFKPRDHYTGLATRRCLDRPEFRKKYLEENDWYTPVVGMSMSMGVNLTVISSDGFAFLTQRGANQSVHQNMFHTSVSEAVSPAFDWSETTQSPDLYRTARRGLEEELGVREDADFSGADLQLLSITVDTHYALYGMQGIVKVKCSAEEILQRWHAGIKDKLENKLVFAIPFTPEDIASFVSSHEPWGGGLICLYHALVYEFGRERVDSII